NSTCNSELDAVPSATSKCRCESIKVGTVAICGDGVVNASAGEQCDQGAANGTPGSCCSSTCTFKSAGTVCRPGSGDVCDPDEKCTGTSADCPVDSVAPIATVCRPAGGECDVTETCSGVGRQPCPGGVKQPPGTQWTGDGNLCTLGQCDGSRVSCQHPAGNPGVVCRGGSGDVCDPDETCTGTSADCPLDVMKTSADVCRAAAGECDLAEMCPGVAGQPCPPDAKKLAATPCTADDKFCTLDQCDGSNVTCQHPPGHAGEACRRGSGALCDPDQPCTGTRP